MKKIIFLNLILHFFIPPIAYANTQIANSFNTAFKQWASDNNWGTGICQISKEEIKLMYFEYTNANKIISSVGKKCKTKSTNTNTQPEQPIADSTTNDIQPSEMSTADACAYWNGIIISDNKCMGTSGYL